MTSKKYISTTFKDFLNISENIQNDSVYHGTNNKFTVFNKNDIKILDVVKNENNDTTVINANNLTELVDTIQNLQSELKIEKPHKIDLYISLDDETTYGGRTDIKMDWIDDGGGHFSWYNIDDDMYGDHCETEYISHYGIIDTWSTNNINIIISELNSYKEDLEKRKNIYNSI